MTKRKKLLLIVWKYRTMAILNKSNHDLHNVYARAVNLYIDKYGWNCSL